MRNRLLSRQIEKYLGSEYEPTRELETLFEAINKSYQHYEEDKQLLERAMDISSEELLQANEKLREETANHKKLFNKLKRSLATMSGGKLKETPNEVDVFSIVSRMNLQIKKGKETEAKLKKIASNLSSLIENTDDVMFSFSTDYTLLTYNSSFQKLIEKFTGSQPNGSDSLLKFIPTEHLRKCMDYLNRTLEGEKFVVEEEVVFDDIIHYYEISVNPILIADFTIGGSITLRNISDKKKEEKKKQKLLNELKSANKELQSFAHIISHDLKAPLRAVGTLANWISTDQSANLDEQGQKQLKLMVSRVNRMYGLIEGVLRYSRVGKEKETNESVNLKALLKTVIETLAPGPNINISLVGDFPILDKEPTRLIQVFQNLTGNAVKFMDKEKGLIEISCKENGKEVEFKVQDNGPGIDSIYSEKVFEIFQTIAPRDEFESTGIGLSIVKKIIEIEGGKIWFTSELGVGTTFYFTLPKSKEHV